MSGKFGTIADWVRIDRDSALLLPGSKRRKVRVEVSTFIKTTFLLSLGKGEYFPLGTVEGQGAFELSADGDVKIEGDANFYYRTADGRSTHAESEAPSFTKIANRRERNLEQEMIEYRMYQNVNRRMARLEAEYRNKMEALGVDPETGEVLDGQKRTRTGKRTSGKVAGSPRDEGDAGEAQGGDGSDGFGDGSGDGPGERPAGAGEQASPVNA